MNTTQTVLIAAGALVLGACAGWFLKPQQSLDCSKCPPPCPTSNSFTNPNLATSHTKSNNYRSAMGYCPTATDPNTHPKEGYFEISQKGLGELYAASVQIESKLAAQNPPAASPPLYRCIFAQDEMDPDAGSKLLIVGLNADASDPHRREYTDHIYEISVGLPCPVLCDAPTSQIIFGDGTQAYH